MDVDLKILQELDEKKGQNTFDEGAYKITRGAFEKAMLYAKLCTRIADSGMECYGYLLMPKDSMDGKVTDVYFADEQLVQEAYVRVTDTAVYNASKIMEPRGYQIVGWWHSHGSFSPFHSGTDVNNFKQVLQSVSPRTMYRNKESIYVIDESSNELKFDNYVVKDIDAKKLKESKPKVIKKDEGQPYAFSMVVNMHKDYYLERITKSFNQKTNQYDVDSPTRPTLMVEDVDNDLEFLVSEIEKDIHKKLIFPTHNNAANDNVCPDWESMNRQHNGNKNGHSGDYSKIYSGPVKSFVNAAKGYLMSNPDMKSSKSLGTLLSFLESEKTKYRYDILRDEIKEGLPEALSKVSDMDVDMITQNIVSTIADTNPKLYFDNSKNLDINQIRNLFVIQFMLDVNNVVSKENQDKKPEKKPDQKPDKKIDDVIKEYHDKSIALAEAFDMAEKAMKSLTYYSMERYTDYKQQKNHKYKNIITSMLEHLNNEGPISTGKVIYNEMKMPRINNSKQLFLFPDRKNIFHQLLRDIYSYNITQKGNYKGLNASPNGKLKNKDSDYMEFLLGFADVYISENKGERKVDEFIEQKLLSKTKIDPKKYSMFKDSGISLPDYTKLDIPKKRRQERSFNYMSNRFAVGFDDEDYDSGMPVWKKEKPIEEKKPYTVNDRRKVKYKEDVVTANDDKNTVANIAAPKKDTSLDTKINDALKNLETDVKRDIEKKNEEKEIEEEKRKSKKKSFFKRVWKWGN